MDIALPVAFTKVLDQGLEFIYGLETYVAPTVVLGMYDLTLSLCYCHRKMFCWRRYYAVLLTYFMPLLSISISAFLNEQSRTFSVPLYKPFRSRLVSMSRH
jgi:hypothetical protein